MKMMSAVKRSIKMPPDHMYSRLVSFVEGEPIALVNGIMGMEERVAKKQWGMSRGLYKLLDTLSGYFVGYTVLPDTLRQ